MTTRTDVRPHRTAPTLADIDITERVWFSAKQAADYLGYVDPKTVRRAHLDGRLRGHRTAPTTPGSRGGNLRFRREWLDAFARGESPARTTTRSA